MLLKYNLFFYLISPKLTVFIFVSCFPSLLYAAEEINADSQINTSQKVEATSAYTAPELWGVAFTYRIAEIPYETTQDTVSDIVPLLYYQKGRFFWRGIEAGYTFADFNRSNVSILGRYRFYDIPAEYQNKIRGDAYDFGVRYRKHQYKNLDLDLELLNDLHGRSHVNLASRFYLNSGNWYVEPYINLRWKSSSFNNYYYGLGLDTPGSGFDLTVGSSIRYQVHRNFYLLGRAALTIYGSNTYRSSTVNTPNQSEVFIGFGFFDDKNEKSYNSRYLKSRPYIRLAHGSATPTNVGEIIKGNAESDPYNNKLTSIFYGVPVSDAVFGVDMPVYFTVGYVQHLSSEVQRNFPEYVIGIKAYYTVNWPTRWRIGVAEGLSYTTDITYIEQTEMEAKGYRSSKLLNYLDFTVDVELGDLFNSKTLQNVWLGYGIHHRSGIFETSSAFGRVKGGSNYTSFYLQYHW